MDAANNFDKRKSLQELEGSDWGEPNYDSNLVVTCHRLRRIPLHELNNEDLRILIGQNIGLEYLVPLAAAKLRMEPLSEGNLYPGDLLQNVLRADSKFWLAHIELRDEVTQIAKRAFSLLPSLCETDRKCAEEVLKAAYDIFERSDYFATHGRA